MGKKVEKHQDDQNSVKVKTDVRNYLPSRLPKKFKNIGEISPIINEVYSKYKSNGLKAIKVSRRGIIFSVEAKASPFENVGITQAEIMFDLDDIELLISAEVADVRLGV